MTEDSTAETNDVHNKIIRKNQIYEMPVGHIHNCYCCQNTKIMLQRVKWEKVWEKKIRFGRTDGIQDRQNIW
jgi:hypothetical protein